MLAYPLFRLLLQLSFSRLDYGPTRGLGGGKGEGPFIFWEWGALKYFKGTGEQAKSFFFFGGGGWGYGEGSWGKHFPELKPFVFQRAVSFVGVPACVKSIAFRKPS